MSIKTKKCGTLGIDAGGTFTDLAFIPDADLKVAARAKTPTLHDDMPRTIENGLALILEQISPEDVTCVNIASTLATNAVVEGKIRPVGLILIGYDPVQVQALLAADKFGATKTAVIAGGHDNRGDELEPLDRESLNSSLAQMLPFVEAMAVSAFFSVRNPSHETAARDIILTKSPHMPVTCGHETASALNAPVRATTAALNSGLIPVMNDLIVSVENIFKKQGIDAPISIVRGDGSLVSAEWAKKHPVETMLSGPAASAIGASHLAGAGRFDRPAWVVDIGGTTTDIIYLDKTGRPELTAEGTTVGRYRTLVKSIDIHTFGLGGDSRIRFDESGKMLIGAGRVRPLCSTLPESPDAAAALEKLAAKAVSAEPLIISPGRTALAENAFESGILQKLGGGSMLLGDLLKDERFSYSAQSKIEGMESRGLLSFSGFTPTDALHVLRRVERWDTESAELGARILAGGSSKTERLCLDICRKVASDISLAILKKSLSRTDGTALQSGPDGQMISLWLCGCDALGGPSVKIAINAAVVGVGAPTWAFLKDVGRLLSEEAILPENADVAGAVGAAVASHRLSYSVLITPMPGGDFRAHLPIGVRDFETPDEAADAAAELMTPWLIARAKDSGASNPVIECIREDEEVEDCKDSMKLYLCTQLRFTVTSSVSD